MAVVKAADILLPVTRDMSAWSVIACDQFTSDPGYWAETERLTAGRPSTLNMIIPEARILSGTDGGAEARAAAAMEEYLGAGLFRTLPSSFIVTDRRLTDGRIRRGIVATIDLDAYDYNPEADCLIKATEATVHERLLRRIALREASSLEFPHALVFYSDPEGLVEDYLRSVSPVPEYDFELMQGGGHVSGASLSGAAAVGLEEVFGRLERSAIESADPEKGVYPVMLAIGDGNHSLATAKLKRVRDLAAGIDGPGRYALAELINIYDGGISMEPIHRVLSGIDGKDFAYFLADKLRAAGGSGEAALVCGTAGLSLDIPCGGIPAGRLVALTDSAIAEFISTGGSVDYIHDDDSALRLGASVGSAYVLMPAFRREDIFRAARSKELFPKKSFSIGSARDKRYYLEGRRIK